MGRGGEVAIFKLNSSIFLTYFIISFNTMIFQLSLTTSLYTQV